MSRLLGKGGPAWAASGAVMSHQNSPKAFHLESTPPRQLLLVWCPSPASGWIECLSPLEAKPGTGLGRTDSKTAFLTEEAHGRGLLGGKTALG